MSSKPCVVLRNANVFAPEPLGVTDVLLCNEHIAYVGPIGILPDWLAEEFDLGGTTLVPGFVDNHVHILGGGGDSGWGSVFPEVAFSELVAQGITTVVGCLGINTLSRNLIGLLAKTYALRQDGVSAWMYSGGMTHPTPTITGSLRDDVALIEPVVGAGEITISPLGEHAGRLEMGTDLVRLAVSVLEGGRLSGKPGVVCVHVGEAGIEPLLGMLKSSRLPVRAFLPTHVNRDAECLGQASQFVQMGGTVDLTTAYGPTFRAAGAIPASRALASLLRSGMPASQVTMSSDGNGGAVAVHGGSSSASLAYLPVSSLAAALRTAVLRENVPFESALCTITANPARVLGLPRKGVIRPGNDADLVALADVLRVQDVWARGKRVVVNGRVITAGIAEAAKRTSMSEGE